MEPRRREGTKGGGSATEDAEETEDALRWHGNPATGPRARDLAAGEKQSPGRSGDPAANTHTRAERSFARADGSSALADRLFAMAGVSSARADPALAMAELASARADRASALADLAFARADRPSAMADPAPALGGGGDFRVRETVLPGELAGGVGAGVLWGGGGFKTPAAAALLRRDGADGVPAVKGAPLRKTAKHKLAVGILVAKALRQAGPFRRSRCVEREEEPRLRRGERKMGGERVRERGGKKRVGP